LKETTDLEVPKNSSEIYQLEVFFAANTKDYKNIVQGPSYLDRSIHARRNNPKDSNVLGPVIVDASFDKDKYHPGDVAYIELITASKSSMSRLEKQSFNIRNFS